MLTSLLDPDLPDGPAVAVGDAALTRTGLLDAAAGVAAALRDLPPGPVAVHAAADVATVVTVVGGLLAGVPVVPVPPDSGPVEREHVLRDSGATAWAGPVDLAGGLPVLVPAPGRATYDGAVPDLDQVALVLYTSGTTGLPKGVPHTGRALAACLDGLAAAWDWTADDVLVHGLPLFHLHGLVLGLLGPLRVGSPLVHTVRPDPAAYAGARATAGGSVYFGVPTVWHRMVRSPGSAGSLRGARLLVSGSAPLPVSTFTAVRELTGLAPLERYGMTETGITLSAVTAQPPRAGWVGLPVGGTETRVVGDEGDGIGRLEVRGPSVMRGYLGRATPELSADGWFATGDVAEVDADGWHRIVGRESTDLIKSGGYRVGAGEVETVLLDHPGVEECAVVGVPDDDLGQRIVAYVVGTGAGSAALGEELVALVAERLSWHKRPREVRFVDALPRNAMGKVQKTVLAEG